jgi:hypothetical protein
MSYFAQWALTNDGDFQGRVRLALIQQSTVFIDDGRLDISALAASLLRGEAGPFLSFVGLTAAAPGFAEAAELENGEVDSSRITDADILAAVQAEYPTVAALYFTDAGEARERG